MKPLPPKPPTARPRMKKSVATHRAHIGEGMQQPNTLDGKVLHSIRQNYLFTPLSDDQFQALIVHAEVREYLPGETIFRQGEPANRFYLVLGGLVRLFRASNTGQEKIIHLLEPGELFAEAVFFMGGHYPVTAASIDRCRLVGFDFQDFVGCVRDDMKLAFRLMSAMSMRIHALIDEIDHLALSTACQRLSCYLLDCAGGGEGGETTVRLRVPKHMLASRLAIKPETLSRLLAKFRDERLIEEHEGTVVLKDVPRLRKVLVEGLA